MVAPDARHTVPWRTIVAAVAVVAGTYLGYLVLRELVRIIAWVFVAGFFAVVLAPAVDWAEHRLHLRRGVATGLVFTTVVVLIAGMLWAFITPVVDQVNNFVDDLPLYVEDAREGRGPAGDLVKRFDLADRIEENQENIEDALTGAGSPALRIVRSVFATIVALLTILVLTILMLLRGPQLCRGALQLVGEPHRDRVRLVAADAAKAVSGYMVGNFVISVICGVSTYVLLRILGVPYAEVIALFVAFADLIPLIGATLGAIPTIGLSFLHSTGAGIAAAVFYVLYQQFENHVLQVAIMSRTVDVNPLTVLLSVLVGVELFGIFGALLAIPVAGIIQVVIRNLYDPATGRFKREPTLGEDQVPISQLPD